ncbi:MAG TPA: D-aminoacyl-tRNA deacylase [Chloroflexota bacterium]|nr:D-aminoacyl-tRNA deacylase [Chloroflexota bacterium]
MRVVIQRVSCASVLAGAETLGSIERGLAILVGVRHGDQESNADNLAQKAYSLRVFEDEAGKMNLSAQDAAAAFLVVSQFTLYANTSRGRRPSFIEAAGPELGERLYNRFVARMRELGGHVETGRFGARMQLELVNDGPVTIIIDSDSQA